jgi:hypothetical protein
MSFIKQAICSFIVSSAFICFGPYATCESRAIKVKEIENIVKMLGRSHDSITQLKKLSDHSNQAIPLLIRELHPIDVKWITNTELSNPTDKVAEAEHVLWCIRGLRFLTGGIDFCATTNYRFGDSGGEQNRKFYLQDSCSECEGKCKDEGKKEDEFISFFALWITHLCEYIAPLDAQKEIIKAWKDWYKTEGKSSSFKPLDEGAWPEYIY